MADPAPTPPPLASEFPAVTEADWRRLAEGVLKGASFEKKLVTLTNDGIALQPIYPRDPQAEPIAGGRGTRPWGIAATVEHPDPVEANRLALADLEGGADQLTLAFAGSLTARGFGLPATTEAIAAALDNVQVDLLRLRLDPPPFLGPETAEALQVFARAKKLPGAMLNVEFGMRPLADWARLGAIPKAWLVFCTAIRERVLALMEAGFAGPFLMADSRPFHEAGASEAQEVASLLAQGITYLRLLGKGGIGPEKAQALIAFTLAADQDQFLTLSKIRAFRRLWAGVLEHCGVKKPAPALIHAESAFRMMTRRDADVNMLRAGLAGLAASLGGADSLTLLPHSAAFGLPDALARRLARNTSLILLKEANLNRMIDPAAGSGTIEEITATLEEKAWAILQHIEAERAGSLGGMAAALETGAFARKIAATRESRLRAISSRVVPVTGVSEFPNIAETSPSVLLPAPAPIASTTKFPSLRLATPFETLRDRADALAVKGAKPRIFLAPLGRLADFTPRAGFTKNAFEAGGIEAVLNDGFALAAGGTDVDELIRAFRASGTPLACLVGTDADYASEAVPVAKALRAAGASPLLMAGKPGEQEAALAEAGISGYLAYGMDLVAFLGGVLSGLEQSS
jgi:methylmalonyl-CoA mutase